MAESPKKPKTKRRKNRTTSEGGIWESVEADELLPDEDLFSGMAGLPEAGQSYFVYRKIAGQRKEEFLNEYPAGCSTADIKRDHGGGDYIVYCRDDENIKRKTSLTIAGEARKIPDVTTIEDKGNTPVTVMPPVQSVQETISLMESLSNIISKKDESSNGFDMTAKLGEIMSNNMTTQMQNSQMIQEMFKSNMELMKEGTKSKSSSDWVEALTSITGMLSPVIEKLMVNKIPAKPTPPPIQNGKQKPVETNKEEVEDVTPELKLIIGILGKGMESNDQDFEMYIEMIEKWDRSIIDKVALFPIDEIISQLKKVMALKNEAWLRTLLTKIKDDISVTPRPDPKQSPNS